MVSFTPAPTPTSSTTRNIFGVVQKGPFQFGQIKAIDLATQRQTVANLGPDGSFNLAVPNSPVVLLEVLGGFRNELNGDEVELQQPLRALNFSAGRQNINILTQLSTALTLGAPQVNQAAYNNAWQQLAAQLGFDPALNPGLLDLAQIKAGDDLQDPNLRLLIFSAALMGLPSESGGLAEGWTDLTAQLQQLGGSLSEPVFGLFSGLDVLSLEQRLRNAAVLQLPSLNLADNSWQCGNICQFVPSVPGLSLSDSSAYESRGRMAVTVRRTGDLAQALEVGVLLEDIEATRGVDYVQQRLTLSLPAQVAEATAYIDLVVDQENENLERLRARIFATNPAATVLRGQATLSILDGQSPGVVGSDTSALNIAKACLVSVGAPGEAADCPANLPATLGLLDDQSQALRIVTVLQSSCKTRVTCAERKKDWQLRAILQRGTGGAGREVVLGDIWYRGQDVRIDGDSIGSSPQQQLSLDGAGVRSLIDAAASNNESLRLRLSLLGQPQRLAHIDIPQLLPLQSQVVFGDRSVQLQPNNVVLEQGGGSCSASDYRLQGAIPRFEPAALTALANQGGVDPQLIASYLQQVSGVPVDVCVALSADGVPTASVTQGAVDLTGSFWGLPPGHGSRALNGGLGYPFVLIGSNGNQELFVDGLPVGLVVGGGQLDSDGLQLQVAYMRYLHSAFTGGTDPRIGNRIAANDITFRQAISSHNLRLRADGLYGQLPIAQGKGTTAYPQMFLQWGAHNRELVASRLQPVDLSAVEVFMSQSDACLAGDCPLGDGQEYDAVGDLRIDGDGRVWGQLAANAADVPGFGLRLDGQLAISRPADLPDQAPVSMALAGFRFAADVPVVARLPGHVQNLTGDLQLHDSRSDAYRLGNYAPTGLSLGPELYVDATAQPQTGQGQDLAGKPLQLNLGDAQAALAVAPAAKYVLRPAGMTGVFNVDPAALGNPVPYFGYPLSFSRFAFRFVDNALDSYTWIDGELPLQGDYADFSRGGTPIRFTGLALDCSGQFAGGNLVNEICDGLDNNGNGVSDENCPAPLAAFSMHNELLGMRFGSGQGDAAPACSSDAAQLLLAQSIRPSALNKPLGGEVAWTPQGELAGYQKFRGVDEYRFEGDESQDGFALKVDSLSLQVDSITSPEPLRYGRIRGRGLMALPFWEAMQTDFRLENRLASALDGTLEAAPSVLAPPGVILPLDISSSPPVDLLQLNIDLEQDIQSVAKNAGGLQAFQVDPNLGHAPSLTHFARYDWGNTGLGFQLPVYYQSAVQVSERLIPSFLGVQRGFDSLVLDVNAGINFIEPIRTKFSFGASADFAALDNLEFKIDLQSGDGLEKIDQALIAARLVQEPLLEPTFGGLRDRLRIFNDFANRGVDQLTEKALLSGVEVLGQRAASISPAGEDPIVSLARGMKAIRSLPEQLGGVLRSEIEQPLEAIFTAAETAVRSELNDLRASLVNAGSAGEQRVPADELQASIAQFDALVNELEQRKAGIDGRLASAQQLVDQVDSYRQQVDLASQQVLGILEQTVGVVNALCVDGQSVGVELSGYLNELFVALENARTALSITQNAALLAPLIELAVQDPQLAQAIRDGQAKLQQTAAALEQKLSIAEMNLRDTLCGSPVDELLVNVTQELSQVQLQVADGGQIDTAVTAVETQLDRAAVLSQAVDTLLLAPVKSVSEKLQSVSSVLASGQASPALYQQIEQQVLEAFNQQQLDLPQANLAALPHTFAAAFLVSDSGSDIAAELFLPWRRVVAELIGDVETAANDAVSQTLPAALSEPDDLRRFLVAKIMQTPPITALREEVNQQVAELRHRLNELVNQFMDQANAVVTGALATANAKIAGVLENAQAGLKGIPVAAANIDGYATIAGTELERLHIGAQWQMKSSTEGQPGTTFGAALDAVSWSANDKTQGCNVDAGESPLDITISAFNLPASLGTSLITMKKIYLGFTLDQASFQAEGGLLPLGVMGGLSTQGEIAFTEFKIYDPAFAAGLGKYELYLGAAAGAVFSTVSAEVAFLAGKTCNQDILMELDPQVAQFIPLPETGFTGAYVRGAAGVPIWTMGCPLTVGVAADFGAWVLAGPPVTLGGLVGGGAFGKVGCVGALRGQVRALGQVNAEGEMVFVGEGFGVAGAGLCEPAGWTSVERSRADGLCVTADALFRAGYVDGWQVLDLSVSAPH